MKHLRIPEPLGAAILLSLLVAILGYGVSRLAEPASEWAARVPEAFREAEYKLQVLKAADAGSDEGDGTPFQSRCRGRHEKSAAGRSEKRQPGR